jgi:hypothetical protein
MQAATPLVEAWFAAPTSLDQRNLLGPAWPASWSKTDIITTRKNLDPGKYNRHVISESTKGAPLVFLYDLIRDALTSGELTTDPPFPHFPETVQAKQAQGVHHHFVAFDSAAVMLIFTPIEILRRQVSIFINPISISNRANVNFPDNLRPFAPRELKFFQVTEMTDYAATPDAIVRGARSQARAQMNLGRHFSPEHLPAFPAASPGSETSKLQPPVSSRPMVEVICVMRDRPV